MKRSISTYFLSVFIFLPITLFAVPASTNYQLKTYEFGAGGEKDMNSTNYKLEGVAGELNGESSADGKNLKGGMFYVQMANTPGQPTFTNDSGIEYNKLKIVLNTSNNPSDTTYAIAISKDNWTTTQYVQSDNTVGTTLTMSNFQTYSWWGGASGSYIIGLDPGITYKVKVKARQGSYTEGPWGPEAAAATVNPTLTFDIDVAAADSETAPPYSLNFGSLNAGSVTTATNKIWVDIDSNAKNGVQVFIKGANGALTATQGYTITSVTGNLTSLSTGWGMQGSTIGQTSGGPITFESPYNGTSENVGIVNQTFQSFISSITSVNTGRASLLLKTKIQATTPAADYSESLTLIAAGDF